MEEKANERKTNKASISILEAVKKHSLILLATLIALAGCGFSSEAKSSAAHGFLDTISRFIATHSSWAFLTIAILIIAQLILYLMKFNIDNNIIDEKIITLENKHNAVIESATNNRDILSTKLDTMHASILEDKNKYIAKAKEQNNKIYNCLKDVRMVHIVSQSDYRYANGKMYWYVNKVCSSLDKRLKDLLDQYCNR